tara:strand:+ start:298 stop:1206 length:909 start_codon:yes stop_codon:yes gene_type:complete
VNVIRLGGIVLLSILSVLNFLEDPLYVSIILFGVIFLLIGALEDIFNFISPIIRALFMLLLISFFVVSNKIIISDVDNNFISLILENNQLIASGFTIICLFIFINGNNFIDGLNGLLLGSTIIILVHYLFLVTKIESDLFLLITIILIPVIIVFLVNFYFGNILAGDGGSYFLGFLVGIISIFMAQVEEVQSFKIACMIFYPCFEVIFTILRRLIINRKNPFYPDGKHLHQLLFAFIDNRQLNISKTKVNSLTSMIILLVLIFNHLIIAYFPIDLNFILYFIILIISYISLYLVLDKAVSSH